MAARAALAIALLAGLVSASGSASAPGQAPQLSVFWAEPGDATRVFVERVAAPYDGGERPGCSTSTCASRRHERLQTEFDAALKRGWQTRDHRLPHRLRRAVRGSLGLNRLYDREVVEFTLDGRTVSAPEGELIVHAAARHGTFIPTLCHDSKLDPYGGCRMCVVEVEGSPRPMPACATRITEGMVLSTNGPITGFQRTLTEMLLSEHLNASPGGRPNELLDMANELGAEAPLILPDAKREEYDDRNRLMGYDPDACILCNRCVRYTQEVMQCSALSLEGRGGEARIVPTWGLSWLDTECELCGGCLSVCPTGAIYEKFEEGTERTERSLEQVRTTCTFCGVGCQIDLNLDPETKHIVKVTSKDEYLPNEGNLCVKGRFAFNFVHHPDRLTEPLVRGEDGELHATTWEHALETAAAGLRGVAERHGPQAIGFLSSARLTNEENYLIQKLARTGVGTNSVHSCEST